ncbi:glycosyltransferase [Paenibacillus glucanolyticus]|uniref:glycosyltransferase n=1 Tax=Paenibacillus glucanolyticus TaxID=59843 RepID=UPI00096DE38A|nr:glycosyltransferase [Paenibacillus glucanolyticus]OMF66188.1 hypothetical protein BK142_29845 [Paenibacillus glucanolyticus]
MNERKTGFFLGFQPGVNLSTEGIGRLLAFVLKEREEGIHDEIVIFCPKWLVNSIHALLEDNKIPLDNFEIVSTTKIPLGIKFKDFLSNRRKKESFNQSKFLKLKEALKYFLKKCIASFFNSTSWYKILLDVTLLLLTGIVFFPAILLLVTLFVLYQGMKFSLKMIQKVIPVKSMIYKLKTYIAAGKSSIYFSVIDTELVRIVQLVNKRKDIEKCFIPTMIWPQISGLKCKKIVAAPDIVFYDFPTQFPGVELTHSKIRETIDSADFFICYSDFVKQHHLIEKCGIEPQKISVIKHANIDMIEHIKLPKSIRKYYSLKQNAKHIIDNYVLSRFTDSHPFYNIDYEQIDYIIYSSQYRPHKNIFNLIKAIRILNYENRRNVKLIVTGDFRRESAISEYVRNYHLENDIFIFNNISSELLAALNCLAKCAVNPTLFEGGFPFTFSEAYSVGTPSVMSEIPVVLAEINSNDLRKKMLFDPYNPYSIADKIIWAVDNASDLYKEQEALYHQFSNRDWKAVATEYHKVFNQLVG